MHNKVVVDTAFCVVATLLYIVTRFTLLPVILGSMQSGVCESLLLKNTLTHCHKILTDNYPSHIQATKWIPIGVEMKHGFLCCSSF